MKRKFVLSVLVILCCALCLSGCVGSPGSVPVSSSSMSSSPSSSSIDQYRPSGAAFRYSLDLPDEWTFTGTDILEGTSLVAEFMASTINDPANIFVHLDAIYVSAVATGDFQTTDGLLAGKWYHMQYAVNTPAFGGYNYHNIYYYLLYGDQLICIVFHPPFGWNIDTHKYFFETYLKTLKVKESAASAE